MGIKLHLGCGKRELPGWVHIDGADFPHIASHDVTKLPYEDNSVDEIYSAHLINYFDWIQIMPIFKEWKRVLKPKGILRIATPDFEAIAKLYVQGARLSTFKGLLFGCMELGDRFIYHRDCWDYTTLSRALWNIGFRDMELYDYKNFLPAGYDDHSMAHFPHNEEAIKTGNFTEDQTLMSLNVVCKK